MVRGRSSSAATRASARRRCGRPGIEAARAARAPRARRAGRAAPRRSSPFAALIDLSTASTPRRWTRCPLRSARALEVALLRAEPGASPPAARDRPRLAQRAARAGRRERCPRRRRRRPVARRALGRRARRSPRRRLEDEPVAFLLARRPGRATAARARARAPALERLDVRPAQPRRDAPAARRAARPQPAPPAAAPDRRVHARQPAVRARGRAHAGRAGPAGRRRGHPGAGRGRGPARHARGAAAGPARRLLLAVALERRPARVASWRRSTARRAVEDAVDAGVLRRRRRARARRRTRCSPPRPGSARGRASGASSIARWPTSSRDEELRALHLALATEQPDEALADTLRPPPRTRRRAGRAPARRCALGRARAAPDAAGRRAAARRAPARARRLPRARGRAAAADRAADARELAVAARGRPARARLAAARPSGVVHRQRGHRAPPRARARREPATSRSCTRTCWPEIARQRRGIASRGSREAEALGARGAGCRRARAGDAERLALYALAWARAHARAARSTTCASASRAVAGRASSYSPLSPERVAGQRLVWRGERRGRAGAPDAAAGARRRARRADSYALLRLHLCELELRVGDWDAAARLLDEWAESDAGAADPADVPALPRAAGRRARAARGGRALGGGGDRARRGDRHPLGLARGAARARASPRCSRASPRGPPSSLRAVWEHTEREGVDEPGVFPGRARARRGARRARRARRGARGRPTRLRDARRAAASTRGGSRPRGAADALVRLAAGLRRGGGARRSRRRPPSTAGSGCASTARGRCSCLGRGAAALQAVGRRARVARGAPRRRSTSSARRAGPSRRASELARVGGAPLRGRGRADADRGARGRARRRGAREQGDRAARSSSPCTRSRCTSRTRTRSSACARGRQLARARSTRR